MRWERKKGPVSRSLAARGCTWCSSRRTELCRRRAADRCPSQLLHGGMHHMPLTMTAMQAATRKVVRTSWVRLQSSVDRPNQMPMPLEPNGPTLQGESLAGRHCSVNVATAAKS